MTFNWLITEVFILKEEKWTQRQSYQAVIKLWVLHIYVLHYSKVKQLEASNVNNWSLSLTWSFTAYSQWPTLVLSRNLLTQVHIYMLNKQSNIYE